MKQDPEKDQEDLPLSGSRSLFSQYYWLGGIKVQVSQSVQVWGRLPSWLLWLARWRGGGVDARDPVLARVVSTPILYRVPPFCNHHRRRLRLDWPWR